MRCSVFLLVGCALSSAAALQAPGMEITQLTDDDAWDFEARVSGPIVSWRNDPPAETWGDIEVFYYDGTTTRVTDNNVIDWAVALSDPVIAWHSYTGPFEGWHYTWEVYLYDGVATRRITNNTWHDYKPHVSADHVVWESRVGSNYNDHEIMLYDIGTGDTTQITDNTREDVFPHISGTNVVWQADDGHDLEIFHYDTATGETTQLTTNDRDDEVPQVSGANVIWRGFDGNDYEIFFYDGNGVTQVTDNSLDDGDWGYGTPLLSGNNAVWAAHDGHDSEIFFYDGSVVTQLTDNERDDLHPEISQGNLVWYGDDGNDFEVFFYDSATAKLLQLTDNDWKDVDPRVSGRNVVWLGYTEGDDADSEIFLATNVPEPSTFILLTMGALALFRNAWRRWRRRWLGHGVLMGPRSSPVVRGRTHPELRT